MPNLLIFFTSFCIYQLINLYMCSISGWISACIYIMMLTMIIIKFRYKLFLLTLISYHTHYYSISVRSYLVTFSSIEAIDEEVEEEEHTSVFIIKSSGPPI